MISQRSLKSWNYSILFLPVLFSSLGVCNPSANPVNSRDFIVTQAPSNLCRQVNSEKGLAVRAQPDSNSSQIGGLDQNQQAILAQSDRKIIGSDGRLWVEIVSPINGYVALGYPNSEVNLINCQETAVNQPENPTAEIAMVNLCRRVAGEVGSEGLAIHADASKLSTSRGGLPPGGRVMLIPNYQLIADRNGEPRTWVQIMEPIAGFIPADSLLICDDVGRSLPENSENSESSEIRASATPAVTNTTTNSTATEKNPELCRRVSGRVAPDGLAIRADASSSAAYLGGVEPGEDVYLLSNYQEIPDRNDPSRNWLQITAPIPGFISAGNLIMCR